MDIDSAAAAHAAELNKSIKPGLEKIAQNVLIGLAVIALAITFKKK